MKICQNCESEFPIKIIIDGKKHNLQTRKFCLECSPFKKHNTLNLTNLSTFKNEQGQILKICPLCKLAKLLNPDNYYISKNSYHSYCKLCNNKKTLERQRTLKIEAIKLKGGKCQICGYGKCPASLDFHHLDPSKKSFSIGQFKTFNLEKLKIELDKCILVCRNCHGEIHSGIMNGTPMPN